MRPAVPASVRWPPSATWPGASVCSWHGADDGGDTACGRPRCGGTRRRGTGRGLGGRRTDRHRLRAGRRPLPPRGGGAPVRPQAAPGRCGPPRAGGRPRSGRGTGQAAGDRGAGPGRALLAGPPDPGRPSAPATTAEQVAQAFAGAGQPVVILDGGVCDGVPSTVVECRGPTSRCLREGAVAWSEILDDRPCGPTPGGGR